MNETTSVKKLAEGYIRKAGVIGALYGLIPTVLYFGGAFLVMPFRPVYVLRMVMCLLFSGVLGAAFNRYGLAFWLLKHRSPAGPATALDGALIGAAVGAGTAFLPPLTSLIGTRHLEEAKWFIIGLWAAAAILGAVIGGILGATGRRHLSRYPN
jgi:hypothetical protein